MLKGNKGEWSELYAFCVLLSNGKLYAADSELNYDQNFYYPIIKIFRDDSENEVYVYKINNENESIEIYHNDSLYIKILKSELNPIISKLLSGIKNGSKTFGIEDVNDFFYKIKCTKLKASSANKKDILIQIHDVNTGIEPVCGFSIKSYLGANPTLINAGNGTNFVYKIENCNEETMNEANAINSRSKIIERINFLKEKGCTLIPAGMVSDKFKENLEFVDSKMPEIISYMVLYRYLYGLKEVSKVIEKLVEYNPINFSNEKMYEYKIKKLLCACALGMTPEKKWEGEEDANGGYIVVKEDGSVVCYHIYNRADFEKYLLNETIFETASTTRHNFGSVYFNEGEFKLRFNLQVRFK